MHRVVMSEEQHCRTRGGANHDVGTDGRIDQFRNQPRFTRDEIGNTSRTLRHPLRITRWRLDGHESTDVRDGGIERLGCCDEKRMHVERIG